MPSVLASTEESVAWPDDAIEVGRIVDAWGIKGGFKVQAYSSDPQALFSSRRWYLQPAPADRRQGPLGKNAGVVASSNIPSLLKITNAREQGDFVVAQAQGVVDRSTAEGLRGARVFVARDSFPSADPDEYYWVDLIGLQVFNRQDVPLGVVEDLIDTGPHCVLRVKSLSNVDGVPTGKDEQERLIPFVSAYVDAVDLPNRRVTVDWGLDY